MELALLVISDQKRNFILRQADQTDLNVIRTMLVEAAEWMVMKGIQQWNPEQFTLEEVKSYFTYRDIYLLFEGEQPAGMFTLQTSDPGYWGAMDQEGYYYLHRLTVRPPYQNLGLGATMVRWAIAHSIREEKVGFRLDCTAASVKLNTFYQNLGFEYQGKAMKGDRYFNLYEWRGSKEQLEF